MNNKILWIIAVIAAFVLGLILRGSTPVETPGQATKTETAETQVYTCSMHPSVQLTDPEAMCPLCGMELIPVMDNGHISENPRRISMSINAQKLANIQTAPVERQLVDMNIRLVGKVEVDETRLVTISSWVSGRIDRQFVNFTGMTVRPGDHLAEIYSPELLSAQKELIQAVQTAKEINYSNFSQQTLDAVREKLRLLGLTDGQISDIEERGKPSDHLTIYTVQGGIVTHRNATEGMYVQTGTPLFTIADLSTVWVMLQAYESDLQWLRYGQNVAFEAEAYPGEEFHGRIALIDPVLNDQTRTINIRVNVNNADKKLKPGLFVRATIHAEVAAGGQVMDPSLVGKWISPMHPEIVKDRPGVCDVCGMALVKAEELGFVSVDQAQREASLVIPATAPLITGKRAVVYVAVSGEEGVYEGREIVLGPRAGDYYLVEQGLEEGEQVVTNGNFKLDSAVQITAGPSMMNPDEAAVESQETEVIHEESRNISLAADTLFAQIDTIYLAYFDLQLALSHDDFAESKSAAQKLSDALQHVDMAAMTPGQHDAYMPRHMSLKESAEAIARANDIAAARKHFQPLSNAIIAVAEQFGSKSQKLLQYHCPMAFDFDGADWLQHKEGTENPYFGSEMFKCGSLKADLSKGK